jgi:molecular chaperone GrpE
VTERHKPDTAHEPVEGEVVEPEPVEAEVVEPEPVEPEVVEGEVVEAEVVEPQVTDASTPGADGADGDVEVTDDLQAAADALEVDLELLLSEREQYLDAYRRAQADFENYRKQAQKRQDGAVVRALGGFVEKLLPVLDACDAALAHGAQEVEPVLAALYGALGKEGLERIDPKGAAFDPAEAEAVMHEPGGGGEQVVSEVLRAGYRWQGRVLRPAMVKVID